MTTKLLLMLFIVALVLLTSLPAAAATPVTVCYWTKDGVKVCYTVYVNGGSGINPVRRIGGKLFY